MRRTILSLLVAAAITGPCYANDDIRFSLEQIVDINDLPINDWIKSNQQITLHLTTQTPQTSASLSANPKLDINAFQIILGDSDITGLFEFRHNSLVFNGGISLPPGENQLELSQRIGGVWQVIGHSNLNVMTSSGFKQAVWTKTLDINVNSQLDEKATGDATVSDKPYYADVNALIGLSSSHQNDTFTIDSHINLLSVSNRQQAVQYGSRLNKANKLDVTDYSIAIKKGNHQMVIGHTSYGNNPLLIDGLSRRGVSWQYQNENDLTLSGAVLSGSDQVGYINFFGLADYADQRVNALGIGLNTLTDSRISIRIEGSYMNAERLSQNDFGIGEVASSETNQGMGLRLIAMDSEGRLNADFTFGFSRYDNPDDFELSNGDELVELDVETAVARNFNLSYLLLQDWESPWESKVNIVINANHASAEPLYQTLTAFVQANIESNLVGAQYQIGNLSGNLSMQSSRDNLDNLVNLLTTKTKNKNFSVNMPLTQIFSSIQSQEIPSLWLPSLDYSFQETHQYALTSPDAQQSGFNGGSHLPNQLTTAHNISASWQLENFSLSVQTNQSNQDNRQIGREASDFTSLQNSASINWQQGVSTFWSLSLGNNRQADLENNKIQYSKSMTVSYNWQSQYGLAVNINYGLSKDDDSLGDASNVSTNADIGIVKNLVQGEWWMPANGSINLRLNYNDSEFIDNVFDQRSRFGTKTAQLSFNLSF